MHHSPLYLSAPLPLQNFFLHHSLFTLSEMLLSMHEKSWRNWQFSTHLWIKKIKKRVCVLIVQLLSTALQINGPVPIWKGPPSWKSPYPRPCKTIKKQKGVCFQTLLNQFGKIWTDINHFKGESLTRFRVSSFNQFSSNVSSYPELFTRVVCIFLKK